MPKPAAPRAATVEPLGLVGWVVLGLLAGLPIVFYRASADVFEVPKVALLVTAALILWGRALGGGLADVAGSAQTAFARMAGWVRDLPRRDLLGLAVILFLSSAAASLAVAPNRTLAFYGAPDSTAGLLTGLATATIYFAARALPGTGRMFDRLVGASAVGAAVAAGYAVLQMIGADPVVWAETAVLGGTLRVFGTLGHPNFLGGYLAMTLPLIAYGAARARGAARIAWLTLAAVVLVALAATLSRGAWIGAAAAMGAWLALRLTSRKSERREAASNPTAMWVIAAIIAVVLVALMARSPWGPALGARVRAIADLSAPTTQSRLHIWNAGLRMAADHPALGVGLDAFGEAFPRYRTPEFWRIEWGSTPAKAHNEAIQILATQGVLGGIAALAVVLAAVVVAGRALRGARADARAAAIAAIAALVGFAVQDLAGFTVVSLGALAAALAGWLAALAAAQDAGAKRTGGPAARPAWTSAVGFGVAALAFLPLVLRPLRPYLAEERARSAPAFGLVQVRAYQEAQALAPWDARYDGRLGPILLRQAMAETDDGARRRGLEQALAPARRAVEVKPSGLYWINLALIQAELARLVPPGATPDQVNASVANALAKDPMNGVVMTQCGYALSQIGRLAEARELLQRAATVYPDYAQPIALIGLIELNQGNLQAAIDTLSLALGRDWRGDRGTWASTWNNLSVAYQRSGRFAEARDAARNALSIQPQDRHARANLELAERALAEGAAKQ